MPMDFITMERRRTVLLQEKDLATEDCGMKLKKERLYQSVHMNFAHLQAKLLILRCTGTPFPKELLKEIK
jgi:hypothetical protein